MSSRLSMATHRALVTAIVLAAWLIAAAQTLALLRLGAASPLPTAMGYFPLPASSVGGLLALFLVWKIGGRADGRAGALYMASSAAWVALVVVPSGSPSLLHRAVFSVAIAAGAILFVRFTMVFPKVISAEEIDGLANADANRSRRWRAGWVMRRIQAFTLSHPSALWWAGAFLVVVTYIDSTYTAYPYYLLIFESGSPLMWGIYLFFVPILVLSTVMALSFLWTGYQLANAEERRRILWIVLGYLMAGVWTFFIFSLVYLDSLAELEVAEQILGYLYPWFLPILGSVIFTGFAVAILYSGAFDVRPIINKTSVYATLGVLFVLLFAVVESLVSEVVEARLGLPGMFGAAAAGVIVTAIVLPLRGRFSRWVDRWIPKADPEHD